MRRSVEANMARATSTTRWARRIATAGVVGLASLARGAEHGGEGGSMTTGDLGQAIMTFLVFAALLAVLSKYAWKPILAQLKRREETIASALERAEKREIEAQTILHQYQTRLENVENEAKDILDESRKEAVALREQTLEEARAEARRSADAAHESIEQAKRDALRELRERTGEMATEVAEQVLRRSLSAEEQRRLLAESMKELSQGAGGRN